MRVLTAFFVSLFLVGAAVAQEKEAGPVGNLAQVMRAILVPWASLARGVPWAPLIAGWSFWLAIPPLIGLWRFRRVMLCKRA